MVIQRIAVIGSGIMGAQIASLMASANMQVYLFDLPGSDPDDPQSIIKKNLKSLRNHKPPLLIQDDIINHLTLCILGQDDHYFADVDCIIEAVTEDLAIKSKVMASIVKHASPDIIIASNTSGLCIETLMQTLPDQFQSRLLGLHFFNPPRYLPLVECICSSQTNLELIKPIKQWLHDRLGRSVVMAHDRPNFIANRIAIFSMLLIDHLAEQLDIGFDRIDALTGVLMRRPKSACYRTADIVGLDTMSAVIRHMSAYDDPWQTLYRQPQWMQDLIARGHCGSKSDRGIYYKHEGKIWVWSRRKNKYIQSNSKLPSGIKKILKENDITKRFIALKKDRSPEGIFIYRYHINLMHYVLYHASDMCDDIADIDLAMSAGFQWHEPVFMQVSALGLDRVKTWIAQAQEANLLIGKAKLPEDLNGQLNRYQPLKPAIALPRLNLDVLYRNDSVVCYAYDDIALLSLTTKLNTIDQAALDGIRQALELACQQFSGVVFAPLHGEHFSAGADLKTFGKAFLTGGTWKINKILKDFQDTAIAIEQCRIPVVAALQGYVLGGGCELMLRCAHRVASVNTYVGLVEMAIGLVPSGGGIAALRYRAQQADDPFDKAMHFAQHVATAKVSSSAFDAKKMGLLDRQDQVVIQSYHILDAAILKARQLAMAGHYPKSYEPIQALGPCWAAQGYAMIENQLQGQWISDHDAKIARSIINIFSGDGLSTGTMMDHQWLCASERKHFMSLLLSIKTLARIRHMLTHGRALRN